MSVLFEIYSRCQITFGNVSIEDSRTYEIKKKGRGHEREADDKYLHIVLPNDARSPS